MNILVTGAKGFVGKNLCSQLENIANKKARWYKVDPDITLFKYDIDSTPEELEEYCQKADFVFNLAGVNRPKDQDEFMKGNFGFASTLLNTLKKYHNTCPVMISSSSQAALDNPYGRSKKAGEELMFEYGRETGAKVLVYRFPNLFGKWCRPNYNSVVATFCNNIANGLPIQVNDPSVMLNLVYIDDVVEQLVRCLTGDEYMEGKYCYIPNVYKVRLGDIADLIYSFDKGRYSLQIPCVSDSFRKALYSTYVSYLPQDKIAYHLDMKCDDRGSFSEFIRTENHGQVSINISKPGITKGQHWHHNLVERFLVVSGHGLIQLRKEGEDENGNRYPVLNYEVSGDKLQVVEMIAGYTHNLINLSETENMVTVIWANGCFDPNRPDTYSDPVESK
ncbi:capsular polysaccharide biosynthesis protein CapF [Bacteroides heparinolyticus]|uniref:Putative LPS biosynthesis epimerase n=1 Tax=Prevotella heparinolytica TaxID=28113 RepID=A0A449I7Q0_9BACE|nr:capsular polysaccharide biosynthesis protein CapF [Bacteroides heparinolyticus]MCI6213165.1 capsular polysaccharide biosynthesis protein CapF [Bacteroides heparinolyticus]VFB15455.1 putative LPS biosynthesis epimerase [Bacteroides heparinolyticus]